MIDHAGPVFRLAEQLTDVAEAELAEDAQGEDLLVGLRQLVQDAVQAAALVPVQGLRLRARGLVRPLGQLVQRLRLLSAFLVI